MLEPVKSLGWARSEPVKESVEAAGLVGASLGWARSEPVKESEEAADPVGPAEGSGSAAARGLESAQGQIYTWHDGDRTLRVQIQSDLTVSPGVSGSAQGRIVRRTDQTSAAEDNDPEPVFRSVSGGGLMTLLGGVLLVLDPEWDQHQILAFFARNDIPQGSVSEIEFLANGYRVETDSGLASLELANSLAVQEGVEVSSPNWHREVVPK